MGYKVSTYDRFDESIKLEDACFSAPIKSQKSGISWKQRLELKPANYSSRFENREVPLLQTLFRIFRGDPLDAEGPRMRCAKFGLVASSFFCIGTNKIVVCPFRACGVHKSDLL